MIAYVVRYFIRNRNYCIVSSNAEIEYNAEHERNVKLSRAMKATLDALGPQLFTV